MPFKSKPGSWISDPAAIASKLPEPLRWVGGAALGGLKELTGGDDPTANLGMPMMAGEGELSPLASKAAGALKGLYSRVSDVANKLPEMIHPNKAASLFKSGASQEEIGYRGLGDFLKGKGNQMVPKSDIISHLEANPEPQVSVKTLGGNKPDLYRQIELAHNHFMDTQYRLGLEHPETQATLEHYNNTLENFNNQNLASIEDSPKYSSYQLPGGENYKENLITIPHKEVPVPGERGEIHGLTNPEPLYQGPHWDDPNVIVHSRTQDRALNPTNKWGPEHFSGGEDASGLPAEMLEEGWDSMDRAFKFNRLHDNMTISGFGRNREEALQDLIDLHNNPNSGFGANKPPQAPGPRIRNIENIQSDWHQAGAKSGYGNGQLSPEEYQNLHNQNEQLKEDHYNLIQEIAKNLGLDRPATSREARSALAINKIHDPELERLYLAEQDLTNRGTEIQNRLDRHDNGPNIPDAPFKSSWLDLGLKHQILDIANDPSLHGISVTPGSELMKRGEGASPLMNDQKIPGALQRLLKPFGGGSPEQIHIGKGSPSRINWKGPGEGTSPHGQLIDMVTGEPQISALTGINNFSDNLYRPITGDPVNPHEFIDWFQRNRSKPDINAPMFRITPEMKELIKKKGLPLMSLLGLMKAQPQSSQEVEGSQP